MSDTPPLPSTTTASADLDAEFRLEPPNDEINTVDSMQEEEELVEGLVGVADQLQFERNMIEQADEMMQAKEQSLDQKRLEKTRNAIETARRKLYTTESKLNQATSAAERRIISNKLQDMEQHLSTLEQEEREIVDRMNERVPLTNDIRESSNTGATSSMNTTKKPKETERDRLIRLGIITPFDHLPGEKQVTKETLNLNEIQEDHQLRPKSAAKSPTAKSPKTATKSSKSRVRLTTVSAEKLDNIDEPSVLGKALFGSEESEDAIMESENDMEVDIEDEDGDSDYSDQDTHKRKRKKRRKGKSRRRSDDEFEPDDSDEPKEDSEYDYEDDDTTEKHDPHLDDGRTMYYQKRLLSWVKQRRRKRDPNISSRELIANPETEAQTQYSDDFELEGGYRCPGDIYNQLFAYQKTTIKWLWELHCQQVGGIIGDEMGLGKTIQIISFLAGLHSIGRLKKPVLVVCPATVLRQWVKELHKWWPPFRVWVGHSTGTVESSHIYSDEDDDSSSNGVFSNDKFGQIVEGVAKYGNVLVTTYAAMRIHRARLIKMKWSYVILDEGHKIRNPDADITLTCKQLRTPHRIILSGTPIQNNLKELWSLFDFVYPGRLGTLPVFEMEFSVPISLGGYANATNQQVQTAYKCAVVLRDLIQPYLLRRMKMDVAKDLPTKTEQVLFVKLTDKQKQVYEEFLNGREVQAIMEGKRHVLFGIDIVRKICNHPDLIYGANMIRLDKEKKNKNGKRSKGKRKQRDHPDNEFGNEDEEEYWSSDYEYGSSSRNQSEITQDYSSLLRKESYGNWRDSGKMKVVKGLLDLWWHKQRNAKHKVLLFCQTRQMQDILEKMMKDRKYPYLKMNGSTPVKDRMSLVDRFNNGPSEDVFVFLLTTRVGGLGINLTSADRVIIYDPDWNPSVDEQSRERAWRLGQRRQVCIYRLMTAGTIEEKILQRQIFKSYLASRILKDPKQKRFFESNQLRDLFTLSDPKAGTETGDLFAGLNAEIKTDKRRTSSGSKQVTEETRRKESSEMEEVKAIKNVARMDKYRNPEKEDMGHGSHERRQSDERRDSTTVSPTTANVDEMRTLQFMGLHSALKHDVIMDTKSTPEALIAENEAKRIADRAINALKESRKAFRKGAIGVPTWTGKFGYGGLPGSNGEPKRRFGKANSSQIGGTSSTATSSSSSILGNLQASSSPLPTTIEAPKAPAISSASILASLRAQNDERTTGETSTVDTNLKDTDTAIAIRLRDYFAGKGGRATSKEVAEAFKKDVDTAVGGRVFKKILKAIAELDKSLGLWELKKEFQ